MVEGTDGWRDEAQAQIEHAIHDGLNEEQPFITGWTLIVTYLDDEGAVCTAFNAKESDRRTATLGMLTHAMEVQRASILADELADRG